MRNGVFIYQVRRKSMPPAYVKTIREEIFYEYAKLNFEIGIWHAPKRFHYRTI